MRNQIAYIMLAWLLGACSAPGIEAVSSTPTTFPPEPAAVATDDTLALPLETPATPKSSLETRDALLMPDASSARWVEVATDFQRPILVTHAGDERLFVVEQSGRIWIVQDGQRLPEPFLDIRATRERPFE